MNSWSLLGLNGGFWFIGIPIIIMWISSDWYIKVRDKNCINTLEDFGDLGDIDELELHRMEFKVSKEEKWKIGQVLKRAEYKTVDELVRNSLYEMIK
jgi:hypothetical protein